MGLPTVVALAGATAWLKTGDPVQVDGNAGYVRRIHPAATEESHAQRN
jgi:phosphohistidine swiveling domain-containing protein